MPAIWLSWGSENASDRHRSFILSFALINTESLSVTAQSSTVTNKSPARPRHTHSHAHTHTTTCEHMCSAVLKCGEKDGDGNKDLGRQALPVLSAFYLADYQQFITHPNSFILISKAGIMGLRVKLIDVKGLWKLVFAIILLYTEVSEVPNLQMEAVRPTLPSAHTGSWILLFPNKPAGHKKLPNPISLPRTLILYFVITDHKTQLIIFSSLFRHLQLYLF